MAGVQRQVNIRYRAVEGVLFPSKEVYMLHVVIFVLGSSHTLLMLERGGQIGQSKSRRSVTLGTFPYPYPRVQF